MPLDLSPCEVHLPTYQPTFDLTKQRFLPAKSVPTVRELVKARQDERILPPSNIFVNRMEDSLMRWKPPGSSYRGTTMAVEGIHPYQLPTAKFQSTNNGGSGGGGGGGTYMMDSFVQWWQGVRANREGDNGGEDTDSNGEGDDEFSLANVNSSGTARTLWAAPPKTPLTAAVAGADHQDPAPPNDLSDIYQTYYGKPVPPEYISGRHRNFHDRQQEQSSQDPVEWIKACFSSCTNM